MISARWQIIAKILDEALELPAEERVALVKQACAGDAALEAEVCKLLLAHDKAGSFLETPAARQYLEDVPTQSPSLLSSGSVVSDRFQILRFIGQGGMGQVYEALDLELRTKVALKTIRPEISSDPRMLARFRREVQLTRLITHPNVCRTFDIDRHPSSAPGVANSVTFLTMELLEGETLATLLSRQGRMSTDDALPLVLQMIEALNAAHTVGVIHRDFKPSNVLLVPSKLALRVVVTDFGLARAAFSGENSPTESVATSLTGNRGMMGTLVYMAPEQFERSEASVTSDIYSLGLVMFEMVTGKRPFADDLPFAEAVKRLKHPAPSAQELLPELDASWATTISKCLAMAPADRYQSARELSDDLLAGQGGSVTYAPKRVSRDHSPIQAFKSGILARIRRKHVILAGIIIVCLVSLLALTLRHYSVSSNSALAEGATVLLTDVQNATNDKRFDATTELIRRQLLQSPYFTLMDSERVHNTLTNMLKPPDSPLDPPTAREIALRNGSPRVIFGVVSRVGDSYVLDVDVEQPDNNPNRFRQHWENHWTWNLSSSSSSKEIPGPFLEAIRDSSDWIRHQIGEAANDIARQNVPPEDVTTANWEALSEFTQAERFRAERNDEAAIVALRNAVAADPNFALAYGRLGDILFSLRRFAEAYAEYDKAIALGQQRLTRRERDRIQGLYAMDTWDWAASEAIFRDYTTYYPHDYLGWFYRATPLMMTGRTEEAIETLKQAVAIDPSKSWPPSHLVRFNLILGNYNDSAKWTQHLRDHGHSEDADRGEGQSDFLQEKLQQSQECFTRLTESKDSLHRWEGYSFLMRLFAEQGEYSKALGTIDEGLKADIETGDSAHRAELLLDRAYLHCQRREFNSCVQDINSALDLDRSLQRSLTAATLLGQAANGINGGVRTQLASELKSIQTSLPKVEQKPISDIVRAHVDGEELLAEGRWQQALDKFRKASQLETVAMDKEYLARALLVAADHATDKASAVRLRGEAMDAYAVVALNPGLVWQWPAFFLPESVSNESLSYARVAVLLDKNVEAQRILQTYTTRRTTPDPDNKQDREARILLSGIH